MLTADHKNELLVLKKSCVFITKKKNKIFV